MNSYSGELEDHSGSAEEGESGCAGTAQERRKVTGENQADDAEGVQVRGMEQRPRPMRRTHPTACKLVAPHPGPLRECDVIVDRLIDSVTVNEAKQ